MQDEFTALKKRAPEWTDGILSKSDDHLKTALAQLEIDNKTIEMAYKEDIDVETYRGRLKTLTQTYTEPMKTNRLKMRVIALILEERGKV